MATSMLGKCESRAADINVLTRNCSIEYASQCYCDNVVHTNGGAKAGNCPVGSALMVCPGNEYEYCGAGNLMNLYYSSIPLPVL